MNRRKNPRPAYKNATWDDVLVAGAQMKKWRLKVADAQATLAEMEHKFMMTMNGYVDARTRLK